MSDQRLEEFEDAWHRQDSFILRAAQNKQEFQSVSVKFVPSDDLARDGEKYVKIAGITESLSTWNQKTRERTQSYYRFREETNDHLAGAVNALLAILMRAINN